MPTRLLKPGSQGPSLEKCLKGMVALGCRVEKDKALMKAHALAKFNSARPILAAGLYSECQEFQGACVDDA